MLPVWKDHHYKPTIESAIPDSCPLATGRTTHLPRAVSSPESGDDLAATGVLLLVLCRIEDDGVDYNPWERCQLDAEDREGT